MSMARAPRWQMGPFHGAILLFLGCIVACPVYLESSFMKWFSIMLAVLMLQPASAAEQIVTLGDSLTFAYEAEFGFNVPGTSIGDGFSNKVRNWVEILNDPLYRHDRFDLGARDLVQMDLLFYTLDFLFRHNNNWAIPGLKVDGLRRFVNGETTLAGLLDPDSVLPLLLEFTNFDAVADFPLADLKSQIQNTAERLTFFIGGNDVREIYGTVYNGGSAGTFVEDFISDSAAILDWVLALNPNIQIVVVNVPHIGITPDIKRNYPTDAVKTERVSAVLRELNRQLAGLASARGLGYADVYTPTLSLLGPTPLCIHGITFENTGTDSGTLAYVWLNGPISANFHPNTSGQAIIANEVIAAFNARYHTGIAPLTATEMLTGLLKNKQTPADIDMTFAAWMTGFGLTGLGATDDTDGDGVATAVEFALGLNPTLHDSSKITTAVVDTNGSRALELAYPIRLPVSARYSLVPASSPDLTSPFTPFAVLPVPGADGLARARLPLAEQRGFLRLQSTLAP
jgi:lysophospholipase L1-like esterase